MTKREVPDLPGFNAWWNAWPANIRRLIKYCPSTGVLTWRKRPREMFEQEFLWRSWNTSHAGKECGSLAPHGYVQVGVLGANCYAHRLAWLYMTGEWPSGHVDHINMCKTDNRWRNLRVVNNSKNAQNRIAANSNNKSGLLGVCPEGKNRFGAKITVNRTRIWLGAFDTPQEAHQAYLDAKVSLHGVTRNESN